MKRTVLIPVLYVCIILLLGCQSMGEPTNETEQVIPIYDAGAFRVPVPESWRVFPIEDPFVEGRPVKTDCVFLRKGGGSDRHVFEKPYIRIDYYSPDKQMERQAADGVLQRNAEDITPLHLGEFVWSGYTADDYQGNACIGRFAVLWTEKNGHKFQVFVWFRSGGESIALEDRDLQAILSGLEPS